MTAEERRAVLEGVANLKLNILGAVGAGPDLSWIKRLFNKLF